MTIFFLQSHHYIYNIISIHVLQWLHVIVNGGWCYSQCWLFCHSAFLNFLTRIDNTHPKLFSLTLEWFGIIALVLTHTGEQVSFVHTSIWCTSQAWTGPGIIHWHHLSVSMIILFCCHFVECFIWNSFFHLFSKHLTNRYFCFCVF